MALIDKFSQILEDSKREYDSFKTSCFNVKEEISLKAAIDSKERHDANILAMGDNGRFMKTLLDQRNMGSRIKLIYIDPPFFSKSNYDAVLHLKDKGRTLPTVKHFAYEDMWHKDMAGYLTMLCSRLFLIRDLLAQDGTVWVHLDWHAVHYVKVFLDEIFGEENFVNEIIWQYKSGGSSKRHFARKHDNILVYSKTKKYYFEPPKEKSYNRGFKPYRFKGVKEYRDDMGWYTMVTMKDVWQVDMVGRTSSERTGYATQKPEALLERIIESSTKEGDICADFFCGSGTLAAVCQKTGRRWICCDQSPLAVSASLKRMHALGADVKVLLEERGLDEEPIFKGSLKEPDGGAGRGEFDISFEDLAGADKRLLRIVLKDYTLDKLPILPDKTSEEALAYILKEAPLALVDCWSVDFDFDGNVFRPEMFFARERGNLPTVCEKLISGEKTGRICIKIVDALGNSQFTCL